jgi:ubiquitin C-terminal hydrolase
LKRIKSIEGEGRIEKNSSIVHVPKELSLKESGYLCGDDDVFGLKGAVVHNGDKEGGHCIAYVKYGEDWYCFNDSNVRIIGENEVLSDVSKNGILFYFKKST